MRTLNCCGLVLLALLLWAPLPQSDATILPIVNGGTNAAAMLTNGKLIYSTIGSIVEAMSLKSSDGKSLTVMDPSATITPTASTKLLLIGMNNNNTATPGLATYTSVDNYPLRQDLPFAHNDVSINFDQYWDLVSTWRSSNANSNFQIYKYLNKLSFNYASSKTQGTGFAPSTAFAIGSDGKTTFTGPLKLPTSGTTASDLNYFAEASINVPYCALNATNPYPYLCSSVSGYSRINVKFHRIGNQVTATVAYFDITSVAVGYMIVLELDDVDPQFLPAFSPYSNPLGKSPIVLKENGQCLAGQAILWDASYPACGESGCVYPFYQLRLMKANGGAYTSSGTSGLCGDITIEYKV